MKLNIYYYHVDLPFGCYRINVVVHFVVSTWLGDVEEVEQVKEGTGQYWSPTQAIMEGKGHALRDFRYHVI